MEGRKWTVRQLVKLAKVIIVWFFASNGAQIITLWTTTDSTEKYHTEKETRFVYS